MNRVYGLIGRPNLGCREGSPSLLGPIAQGGLWGPTGRPENPGISVFDLLFGGPFGPLLIALARVVDMTLATLRMVCAVRGQKLPSALIGFGESLIWVSAVAVALQYVDSPMHLMGYAGGFAVGSYVGIWVEQQLAFGYTKVQVLSRAVGVEVADALRERSFGVTEWVGQGMGGRVEVLSIICERSRMAELERVVQDVDPMAMIAAGELRAIRRGWLGGRGRRR